MSQYSVKRKYINSPKNQKKINKPTIYFLETAPPLCGITIPHNYSPPHYTTSSYSSPKNSP